MTSNLPAVTGVQILIDGKEVDTLAGHLDLRRPIEQDSVGFTMRLRLWALDFGKELNAHRQRTADQLRPTHIHPQYLLHPEGSVLIEAGRTKVICTASVEDRVPPFLRNTGKGWVTAEYGMLPRATSTRTTREASQERSAAGRRRFSGSSAARSDR